MGKNESTLKTKVSPLIEGQSPDFVQADHSVFIKFVKDYYKFLESGELILSGTINNLAQETDSSNYILTETGDRIVEESSTIVFTSGETIVGSTSKATATVLVSDVSDGTKRLFISAQQKFKTGETIVGRTSGSQGTIVQYRGNPVQNIQQLLEYADSDNTIYDFLDNMRDSFMQSIPYNLADDVDKRKLIQNIKQLYKAKGTARGHQLLMRLLFDEDSEVNYPSEKMLRVSDSGWLVKDVLRVTIAAGTVDANEFEGQKITGVESETTSIVETTQTLVEGGVTFSEFDLDNNQTVGTFTIGEQITAISNSTDLTIRATVKSIVTGGIISDRGSYYTDDQTVHVPTGSSAGNGEATAAIDAISSGEVDGFIVDDAGTGYVVGDALVFNNTGAGGSSVAAQVGVVGGGFAPEAGTVAQLKMKADDHIVLEPYTTVTDSKSGDKIVIETGTFANLGVSSESGEITDIRITNPGNSYSLLPKVSSITSSAGASGKVRPFSNSIGQAQDIKIINYGLEYGGDLQLVTESGTGTFDIVTEDDNNIKIANVNATPELLFYRNAILKDVSGTWVADSALTSHNGTVVSYDTDRQLLTVKITSLMNIVDEDNTGDNILFEDEDTIIYEDEVQWGDGTDDNTNHVLLEDNSGDLLFEDNDNIVQVASIESNTSVRMSDVTSTIAHASYATGNATVGAIATSIGTSVNDKSKVSEDSSRIQDSYYYQDYSYEIAVGQSLNEYRDALKKSTHPAGWQEFGKVSLATLVSARIKTPAGTDVSGFDGDDTFTPELASTFETIFKEVFGRRLGTSTDGSSASSSPAVGVDSALTAGERDVTLTSSHTIKLPLIRTTTKASFGYGKPTLSEIPLSLFTHPPSMFTIKLEDDEALLNEDGDEVIFENGTPIGLNWAGRQIMAVSDNTDGHSRFMPFQQFGSVTIKSISTQSEFLLEDSYGDDINFIELEAGTGTSPPYLQLEDNTAGTPKIPREAFYTEYVNAKIPGHVTGGKFLNERYSNTNFTFDSSSLKFDDNSA